jgi:hypothetical protein
MDVGLGAAGAVAETPQNNGASQEGTTPRPGAYAGPIWHPSERWRSAWDGEFESPLLQQPVCLSGKLRV